MGLWDRIKKRVTGGESGGMERWVYVKCERCGEVLKARVDLRSELSANYGERPEDTTYYVRKVIVGSNGCFNPIAVRLDFDAGRNLTQSEISGGTFLTEEEYNEEISKRQASKDGSEDSGT